MSNEVVVRDDSIRELVPFEPMDYDEAVLAALGERASGGAAVSELASEPWTQRPREAPSERSEGER